MCSEYKPAVTNCADCPAGKSSGRASSIGLLSCEVSPSYPVGLI